MKDKELKEKNVDIKKAVESYHSETSINKDGSYTSDKLIQIKEEQLKDKNFLLKAHGFDTKAWELISARNNIWNVYSKQDGVQELYSSKIVVKPITGLSMEQIEEFYENLVNTYSSPTVKNTHRETGGYLLEVPIVDLHLNKLSMSEDVNEPYNFELARERFNFIIDDVINNTKGMNVDKIVFPIGNDLFNCDVESGSTTAGTPQHNEVSPQTMFDKGVMLLVDGISKLAKVAPVEVFCVAGNHDYLSSFHALCAVWAYFHNDERITVDKSTSPRKYVKFGNCLIGFAHGDKEGKRLDGIMQIEAREVWGECQYQEWHLGHLHSEHLRESNGIIIRNLSSVAGSDSWHHKSGYVGAIKKSQSFLWDKEYGLKTIMNTVIK